MTDRNSRIIMIVDDEDMVRGFFKDMILNMGYKVVDFSDPVESVKYYRENFQNIELVVFDLIMPGLSGRELFFLMKQANPGLRSIIVSGTEQDRVIDDIINAGCRAFLKKPVSLQSLEKTIESALK